MSQIVSSSEQMHKKLGVPVEFSLGEIAGDMSQQGAINLTRRARHRVYESPNYIWVVAIAGSMLMRGIYVHKIDKVSQASESFYDASTYNWETTTEMLEMYPAVMNDDELVLVAFDNLYSAGKFNANIIRVTDTLKTYVVALGTHLKFVTDTNAKINNDSLLFTFKALPGTGDNFVHITTIANGYPLGSSAGSYRTARQVLGISPSGTITSLADNVTIGRQGARDYIHKFSNGYAVEYQEAGNNSQTTVHGAIILYNGNNLVPVETIDLPWIRRFYAISSVSYDHMFWLYSDRTDPVVKELFGGRLIHHAVWDVNSLTRNSSVIITEDSTGTLHTIEIVGVPIKDTIAVDHSGGVYVIQDNITAAWGATIAYYDTTGTMKFEITSGEITEAGTETLMSTLYDNFDLWYARFDENKYLSIRQISSDRNTSAISSVVLNNYDGTPYFVSDSSFPYVPYIDFNSNYTTYCYDAYDGVESKVYTISTQTGSTGSSVPDRALTGFYFGEMKEELYLELLVLKSGGEPFPDPYAYKTAITVNDEEGGYLSYDWDTGTYTIQLEEGDTYTVYARALGFKEASYTGVFDRDNNFVVLILETLSADRTKYEVRTPADLLAMANDPTGEYLLMNDIDMIGIHVTPLYTDKESPFMGILRGNNFSIVNMTIDGTGLDWSVHMGFICHALNAQFFDFTIDTVEAYGTFLDGFGCFIGELRCTDVYGELSESTGGGGPS